MANASVYNALIQPLRSVADYDAQYAERDSAQARNALLQMQMKQAQQGMQQQEAVKNAFAQYGASPQAVNALMSAGAYTEGMKLQEQLRAQAQEAMRLDALKALQPTQAIDANRVSGVTGPRPEALAVVGKRRPFDPAAMLATGMPAEEVAKIQSIMAPKADSVAAGNRLVARQPDGSFKEVYAAPDKPEAAPEIVRLMNYRDTLAPNDPRRAVLDASITKSTTHAPGTNVRVDAAPKAFWTDVGKNWSDVLTQERGTAQSAAGIVQNVANIRQAAQAGAYQGTGAELKLGAAKALGALGMPYDQKTVANTELFSATANKFVLDSIKQLGANPSNADREFIEKTVPRLQTDPAALPSLLDFMESKARSQIRSYNSKAKQVQARPEAAGMPFSLEVPEPAGAAPAAPPSKPSVVYQFDANGNLVK